jgi:TM2 domain-containing membrane protein YozV
MKRWTFLIVLLTCIHCFCYADAVSDRNPDSMVFFAAAPTEFVVEEYAHESMHSLAAPENHPGDSIKALTRSELLQKEVPTDKIKKRKKLFAALLAFPVPFGIIGLHRIYLGSKPYIPLIYIGTLGGGFGIIPFIDFIVICLEKDITKYCNNPNLIMWAK